MRSDDLRASADLAISQLAPQANRDWSVLAGDLDWSCRRTLDHMIDTMIFYSGYLATRAKERMQPLRNGDEAASIESLVTHLDTSATILTRIAEATPPDARAFHPSGLSDAEGFLAMGCSELLTHTDDILRGLGIPWNPEPVPDLCDAIITRIFPWAPDAQESPDRWQVLRWACGQTALPTRERLDDSWWWHAAPLSEWDGTRNRRTAPPAWS
jgi:hypothetical protein